jgi:hypothetical protein
MTDNLRNERLRNFLMAIAADLAIKQLLRAEELDREILELERRLGSLKAHRDD